jgi:hypothetical protein
MLEMKSTGRMARIKSIPAKQTGVTETAKLAGVRQTGQFP